MSGDVQPRKRKDKKRKKDEGGVLDDPSAFSSGAEDYAIHVHKDVNTGGGICAKIIFFLLFAVLIGLTSIILLENRSQDIEQSDSATSRFAQFFEGWIDDSPSHHDKPDSHDINYHEDEIDEKSADETKYEAVKAYSNYQGYEENEGEEQNDSEGIDENLSEEDQNELDNEDDEEEPAYSKEGDERAEEEEDRENKSEEEYNGDSYFEMEENSDIREEYQGNGDNEDDHDNDEHDTQEGNAENNQESHQIINLILKIGVGISLIAVAQILIRKWTTNEISQPSTVEAEIHRRNTIIIPPSCAVSTLGVDPEPPVLSSAACVKSTTCQPTSSLYQVRSQALRQSLEENKNTAPKEDVSCLTDEKKSAQYNVDDYTYEPEGDYDKLMKRLESRYGKMGATKMHDRTGEMFQDDDGTITDEEDEESEQSDSYEGDTDLLDEVESDEEMYSGLRTQPQDNKVHSSTEDWILDDDVNEAEQNLKNRRFELALSQFNGVLSKSPREYRAHLGRAKTLEALAEQTQSNAVLRDAVDAYQTLVLAEDAPADLVLTAGRACVERMSFLGMYRAALALLGRLAVRFPDEPEFFNRLAVTYLIFDNIPEARERLKYVLVRWPDNGYAKALYGFILKTVDGALEKAVRYLKAGIESKEEGTADGRFYFQLGDALFRLGKQEEAMMVYEDGVRAKVFLSKYQRSLYNINRLKAKPWWNTSETPYFKMFTMLEDNWETIRDEAEQMLNTQGYFEDETEQLKDTGNWKQLDLFIRGNKVARNCVKCPKTCTLIEQFPDAKNCRRGQIKFSVMQPGTHVWPHCGPTNCRLRAHLGLKVPFGTYLRVAEVTRSWEQGKFIVFDDSFEHEVWHNGTELRLVLIVDVWHPDLTAHEKKTLPSI